MKRRPPTHAECRSIAVLCPTTEGDDAHPLSLHAQDLTCIHANFDPTTVERPRNKKVKSPPKTAEAPSNGDFTFITGNKPADFRSKKTMTAVRRKAMDSFLKTDKSKDGASRSSAERSNSDASDTQVPPGAAQHAVEANTGNDLANRRENRDVAKRPSSIGSAPSNLSSSSEMQVRMPRAHTTIATAPTLLIIPSRKKEDVQGGLLFDEWVVPPLRSIGKSLDPFRTMYQSSHPRVSVEALKHHCSAYFGTYGLGKYWIPYCVDHPHTFLSTLCLAAAHYDVLNESSTESLTTSALRQDIIVMVGENLLNPTQSVADHNIIAVSQLIICEVISRKEADLRFHEKGMETMITQRGGLSELGVQGRLASAVSWVNLASAILREALPRPMYFDFCCARSTMEWPISAAIPESPIFCPRGDFFTIRRSRKANPSLIDILHDVRTMVSLFLQDAQCDGQNVMSIAELYKRISEYPTAATLSRRNVLKECDWKYEAIRITALVQATAIFKQLPLSESLVVAAVASTRKLSLLDTTSIASRSNESIFSTIDSQQFTPVTDYSTSPSLSMVSPSPGIDPNCFPFDAHSLAAYSPQASPLSRHPYVSKMNISANMGYFPSAQPAKTAPSKSTKLLRDLKETLEKSNLSDCWSDMAGVLLWIGLVMGAASRDSDSKVLSKYFSATTMRAGIMLCFDHPEAMHATMLKMTQVVQALSSNSTTGDVATTIQTNKRQRQKQKQTQTQTHQRA